MSMKSRKDHKRTLVLGTVIIVALCIIGGLAFWCFNKNSGKIQLEKELYGRSEAIDIDAGKYQDLVAQKKSFVILVDKPGCVTTETMRENMKDMNFRYYRIMLDEMKASTLHDYVKLAPSVAIVNKGKVITWLKADSNEDVERYNDKKALKDWLESYIAF